MVGWAKDAHLRTELVENALGLIPEGQAQHLRKDLLAYSKLDTLAMIKVRDALREEGS